METDRSTGLHGALPLAAGGAPYWGLIRATGADAAAFLHSQLTSDFAALGDADVRLAGYCSAKGRLLASFVAWRQGTDEIVLACHHSVLAATLKRLSMFVLRAKCRLADATGELALHGLAGEPARAAVGDLAVWRQRAHGAQRIVRLPDAAGAARALVVSAEAALPFPALGLDDWRWLEVQSGVPHIEASTADRFVPQMLNFDLLGGVHFQKGCYPGQEVVARTQYRGAVKRRTFLYDIDAECRAGDEVFHGADPSQPAGLVANAAPRRGRGWSALVEVKLAALGEGTLHLGAPDGPALARRELPYRVPLDAEQAA